MDKIKKRNFKQKQRKPKFIKKKIEFRRKKNKQRNKECTWHQGKRKLTG